MKSFDLWDAVLIGLISLHLMVAPYSKVEESFNTQAIYDFVNHGLSNLQQFDHLEFPGAIQRTFIGSGFYGYFTKWLGQFLEPEATQFHLQLLARSLLGLFNAIGFIYLRHSMIYIEQLVNSNPIYDQSIFKKEGKEDEEEEKAEEKGYTGLFFALFQYSQFHLIYYSSRFLPNFIALPLTNIAFGHVLKSNYPFAFFLLSFTGIVFRIEILPLMASLFFISVLIFGKAPFWSSLSASLFGISIGGLSSLVIDTALWNPNEFISINHLLKDPSIGIIPEISSFFFNVVHKQASNWGTEPFNSYFTTYLKKLFFPPTVISLFLLGLFHDSTKSLHGIKILGLTALLHILIMSFQPHKEWRFIAYDLPLLTLAGSSGINHHVKRFKKNFFSKLLVILTIFSCLITFVSSLFMLYTSRLNYPGGDSLNYFNNYFIDRLNNGTLLTNNTYSIHLDVFAKSTGITLFEELQPEFLSSNYNVTLIYNKSESDVNLTDFDFLISETVPKNYNNIQWSKVTDVYGFGGVDARNYLMIGNKFDPQPVMINLAKKIINQGNLNPLKEFVDNGIVVVPLIGIYEKHYLL